MIPNNEKKRVGIWKGETPIWILLCNITSKIRPYSDEILVVLIILLPDG
jgi:hypothetical protein